MARNSGLKWWQLLLVSVAVSALGGLSGRKSSRSQRKTYTQLKQAPWAPPGWVFAPAWTFNNYFVIAALLRLVRERGQKDRHALLTLQGLIWLVFFTFNYAYFNRRSPLLAAALTVADAYFAIASLLLARASGKRFAANYLPLSIWTSFASTLAIYQALYNSDPVFNTRPPIVYANNWSYK